MTFDDWLRGDGAKLAASGCPPEVLAKAAWDACKTGCLEIIDERMEPPAVGSDDEYLELEILRGLIDAAL